jgi:ATP-binding cassette subfamily F protein 2
VGRPEVRAQTLNFRFAECSRLSPPVLPFDDVSFAYSGKPEDYLYHKLNLGVDCDSRVALVRNAAGGSGCVLRLGVVGEAGRGLRHIPPRPAPSSHPHFPLFLLCLCRALPHA